MIRTVLSPLCLLAAGLIAAPAGATALRVYNWAEFIAPGLVEAFTEETGIAVTYDTYASGETVEAMLLAGGAGYDLVVVSSEYIGRLVARGSIAPLDAGALSRHGGLDPAVMGKLDRLDPGNRHAVPYLWGTTGLGIDREKIAARMPDAPLDSWALLFEPANVSRFSDCGVGLVDAPEEVLAAALLYLGHEPGAADEAARAEALGVLQAINPHVTSIRSTMMGGLASGEFCLVLGWSSDVVWAREHDGAPEGLDFVIPREGGLIWFDVFVIPADAADPEAAHRFIDFMLRPEIIAQSTDYLWTANAVPAADVLTDPDVLADPAVVPDAAMRARLHAIRALDAEQKGRLDSAWTRLKLGLF